jgi:hypothetical protein
MSASSPVAIPERTSIRDRNVTFTFDLARAIVENPVILAEIPSGATLVLLPRDADAAFIEENIALGLAALREGRNVYFRHLAPGEWSAPGGLTIMGSWEDHAIKRERLDSARQDDATPDEDSSG